MWKEITLT